ncbi:hypothetical protein DITRI_Ditri02bG0026600 [Diplodiscus trichospermus]
MQYVAFYTFLGLVLCLFWNIIAVSIGSIKEAGVGIWFLAVIYFLLGVPGAYILWYRPLYRACGGFLSALYFMDHNAFVGILYFIGFGLFCAETLSSIWVIQKVYRYFRGTGKAAEAKRNAARGTAVAAIS